jgi:hypothetical protein
MRNAFGLHSALCDGANERAVADEKLWLVSGCFCHA